MPKYQEILDAIGKLGEGFGRIDERTRNIWRTTEAQEKHLKELNGSTKALTNRVTIVETKLNERTTSPIVKKMSRKAKTGYGGIVITIGTLLYYLGQANGWW